MRIRKSFRVAAVVALALGVFVPGVASAQKWKDVLNKVTQKPSASSTALSDSEVASGLKNALADGVTHAINTLGRSGGFSDNPSVRIPLPGALATAGKLARKLGQGEKVDAFQLSLNRAAEKAVPEVADIFGDAIRSMTLKDARSILAGGDHAATDYFRRVAGKALAQRIEPIVSKATDSVGVTRKYKALTSSASADGGVSAMLSRLGSQGDSGSLDLDKYVTDKTIDGLFTEIGNQEKAIRTNPAARTTDLLKKVFGH